MGCAGYDWIAIDLEHGSISISELPDLFRAIELGNTLPLARIAQGSPKDCKQALDAGAGGIIVPMIESAKQLTILRDASRWPPAGKRGVGYSRANLFGKKFNDYLKEAQAPLLIAQIENINAIDNLEEILKVEGLDAIMIGPYDLSASMGITAEFDNKEFIMAMDRILNLCNQYNVPCGVHVVQPDPKLLEKKIQNGYQFIAYSADAIFLNNIANCPIIKKEK
jgi:2-dehydro-3-deoxyglucarate aldolase